MLTIMFRIPTTTPLLRVLWHRRGVTYASIVPRQKDNYALRDWLVTNRHVGWSEVRAVESFTPKH